MVDKEIDQTIGKLIQLLLEHDEKSDFSDFKLYQKRILKRAYKKRNKVGSSHTIGRFQGLLFENYVLNLLTSTVNDLDEITWYCPPFQRKGRITKKPNCIQYKRNGDIVILRGKHAYAEYDALMGIDDHVLVFEMKYTQYIRNISPSGTISRINKLKYSFNIPVTLILVISQDMYEKTKNKFDKYDTPSNIFLLPLSKFEEYLDKFNIANYNQIKKKEIPKLGKLKKIFPDSIEFERYIDKIRGQFFSPNIDPINFWKNCPETYVLGKVPIGKIPNKNELQNYVANENMISDLSETYNEVVVYLRFDEKKINVDLIVYFKQAKNIKRKNRIPFKKSKIRKNDKGNYQLKRFQRLNPQSFYYWDAIDFVENYKGKEINWEYLELILERCEELTI